MEKRIIKISEPCFNYKELNNVTKVLNSGWITQGNEVRKFENLFSKFHRVKYSIATNSCTTGLHLILTALDFGYGDEIIVPAYSWISTANSVLYTNAKLVLVDVDPKTNNICFENLKKKITKKTKAIIIVHLFGLCVDIRKVKKIVGNNIKIIEDAACASGSKVYNKFAGSLGIAASFSFHPRKVITTGEGGMVTTSNKSLAQKILQLRNHGASIPNKKTIKPYFMPIFTKIGFNYRMTDIQGSIGVEQIKKLNYFINQRNKWAKYYNSQLNNINWLTVPSFSSEFKHSWQAYVIHLNKRKCRYSRNTIMNYLQKNGIFTRPGTHAIHMQKIYSLKYNFKPKDFPGAYFCQKNSIALPLHNKMTKKDFDYVINCLKKI